VVPGQYLGFTGIVAVAVAGALGAGCFLSRCCRILAVAACARPACSAAALAGKARPGPRRHNRAGWAGGALRCGGHLRNGGDNIGVYVPAFTQSSPGGLATYVVVFLVLVAVWCAAGRLLATRPIVARALARRGHLLLPTALIGLGLAILIQGGAFGIGAAE
jgi:cadmium resistance protein CadD (predicted permease)